MSFRNSRISRLIRYFLHQLRLPRDKENIAITTENIRNSSVLTSANLWVLVAAIFIASLGLNTNSTAVIIGAMLISPLMGPIIGFGLGLGTNDFALVNQAIRNFIIMVFLSVLTSTLFFLVSPVKDAGSELLGRTSPTVYDVLIAFFGGMAGIIAGGSKLRSGNVVPGVAIATALMPPLCTMGYGISHLNWQYTAGAFYLFMINSVFIALATYFIVTILGYPDVEETNPRTRRRLRVIIPLTITLMIAPSIYLTYHIVKKYFYEKGADQFIHTEILDGNHVVITSKLDYKPAHSQLKIVVVGEPIDSVTKVGLQQKLNGYGLVNCSLILYQGDDGRAAARDISDALHTNMETTQTTISDIYLKMDSLQRKINRVAVLDSLQATIAREIKKSDSTLTRFTLRRVFSFNPSRNANDTVWYALANFENEMTELQKFGWEGWLKTRLNSPNVKLEEE